MRKLLCIVLIPFSVMYGGVMSLRNFFFDKGIFRITKHGIPVVSVGNLTTGGTGKTPLTLWLAYHLISLNRKVAVISRGYGRTGNEELVICDGHDLLAGVDESGDELAMIAEELLKAHEGRFIVTAGNDRNRAIRIAAEQYNADAVILDDAFQHRRTHRDVDIVLVNAEEFLNEKFSHRFTVPAGNLRENIGGLNRADIVIQNNKFSSIPLLAEIRERSGETMIMEYKTECIVDSENTILQPIAKDVILFSGLADNLSFFKAADSFCSKITDRIEFEDHHKYSVDDLNILARNYTGNEIFLTTHKDYVKVRNVPQLMKNFRIFYLKIGITLENPAVLTGKLNKMFSA